MTIITKYLAVCHVFACLVERPGKLRLHKLIEPLSGRRHASKSSLASCLKIRYRTRKKNICSITRYKEIDMLHVLEFLTGFYWILIPQFIVESLIRGGRPFFMWICVAAGMGIASRSCWHPMTFRCGVGGMPSTSFTSASRAGTRRRRSGCCGERGLSC